MEKITSLELKYSFPFDRHCCYVEVINAFLMLDLFEWDYFTFNGTKKW